MTHKTVDKKPCSLHKNAKIECLNANISHKRVVHDNVSTSSTSTTCHDVGDDDIDDTSSSSSCQKDNTSRKQN